MNVLFVAIICWGVEFVISIVLGVWIFGSEAMGLVIWCLLMAGTVKYFLVSVPEVTGLLTVDAFTGQLRSYGPGLHLVYPWELVKYGNYINLRIVTEEMEETYPSLDSLMHVKWSFQYQPLLSGLARYIAVDDKTIKEGLKDVGSSVLSGNIALLPGEECKKEQGKVEIELRKEFATAEPTPSVLYGIELVRVSLADIDFEEDVQAIRATKKVAATIQEIATSFKAGTDIDDKDALNAALITHGKVKKEVVEVEGEGGKALAGLLMGAFRGRSKE